MYASAHDDHAVDLLDDMILYPQTDQLHSPSEKVQLIFNEAQKPESFHYSN